LQQNIAHLGLNSFTKIFIYHNCAVVQQIYKVSKYQ